MIYFDYNNNYHEKISSGVEEAGPFDNYLKFCDHVKWFEKKVDSLEDIRVNKISLDKELDLNKQYYSDNKIIYDLKKKKYYFYICPYCKIFPTIELINCKSLKILCDCDKSIIININNFFQKYEKKIEKKNEYFDFINNNLKCKVHKKKYKYYCETCKNNICRNCLLLNEMHKGHNIKIFDFLLFDFNIKLQTILNKIYDNKNGKLLDNKFKGLYRLIKVIITNYKKYPCYIIFRTVKNIYNFLLFNIDNNDSNNPLKEVKITKIKEINNINSMNNIYLITSIIISRQKINLEDICKADLVNLDVLELPNNDINDISPLKYAKFQNLKHLNLLNNKIDDINIPYFKEFNFKLLSCINLSLNLLTDFKFFEVIKNFPSLNYLLINSNKFEVKDSDLICTYDLSPLEKINISDKVLLGNSIKILNKMKLDKLKILYLNNNNITSLSELKEIKSEYLEEIYLNDNELESMNDLETFKTLTKIQIINNKINNIDDLEYLIKKLPNLKKINLKGNRINNDNEKLKFLKEKYNNIKIII